MPTSAAAHERELYRYYQPDTAAVSSTPGEETLVGKASIDPCLTAFAQLGAQRLNARRGIITLSSSTNDYMLAESGKELSLQRDNDKQDQLWHGVGAFKCPTNTHTTIGAELAKHFCSTNDTYVVINDLTKHDAYKDKCVVVGSPHLRFIAAVPLRTPNSSVVIGNYIVADDNPRDGLTELEIEFMIDAGVTVMDYLEAGLVKRKQYRAERMVKAIGLFIEGKSTLRDWWLELGHKHQQVTLTRHRKQEPAPLDHLADAEFGVQDPVNNLPKAMEHWPDELTPSASRTPSSSAPSKVDFGDGRPMLPKGESHFTSSNTTTTQGTLAFKSWKDMNSSVTTFDTVESPTIPSEKRLSGTFESAAPQVPDDMSKELQEALVSTETKNVFSRASNLIREAIGVQGVLFFDASVGTFGASSDRDVMEERAPGQFNMDQPPTSSEDELAQKLPPRVRFIGKTDSDCTERPPENTCSILGYSTRRRSSLRGHRPPEEYERLPETIMRRLLKRYPHGKVFNFDSNGYISPDESDDSPEARPDTIRARQKRNSREAEAKAILSVLPEARSVFWFPLWDQNRERWYAGTLVWSTSPTRAMCPTEDLTYLAAFGDSAMAEVARISAQALDKMKSDFISSISHELRSPLHGVLASVEFLQETSMTEEQEDMVNNIHASGKVLLDTINHVLDFSKVNRKSSNRKKTSKRAGKRKKKRPHKHSLTDNDEIDDISDITVLSEEVIETIYAGQTMGQSGIIQSSKRNSDIASKVSPITIVTDIKWHPNWTFEIDRGAWSRILMNIFSNAMKYTKTGFVRVSIELENEGLTRDKTPRTTLLLKVEDSGKGISDEYLKHKLYEPFSQEDPLAAGTGLGLSIVRHIVQDLGGQIHLDSELGTGTEVTVQFPLALPDPSIKTNEPNFINEMANITRGFKFHLAGFDRYPDITETPTGILAPETQAAMYLKSSIHGLLTNWFEMKASQALAVDGDFGIDVITIMESERGDEAVKEILGSYDHNLPTASGKSIAIVLCSSYHHGPKMHTCGPFQVFYMQQPYGPHKAAKILHSAFCQPSHNGQEHEDDEPTQLEETKPAVPSEPSESVKTPLEPEAARPTDLVTEPEPEPVPPSPTASDDLLAENNIIHEESTPAIQQKELRVLLVEDNEINLKLLIASMRKLCINHSTAVNGLEALNAYKGCRGQFDVIFMDISMPIMSGIDSARHIRRFERDEGLGPTKLIALTGAANPTTRQEAFASGIDLYLTKPVTMKGLGAMLEDFIKEKRADGAGGWNN